MGLTFKENCPDLRNSKVVDIIRELQKYGAQVDVYDPWIDAREAQHEYGITPGAQAAAAARYDAVVMAVAHDEFKRTGHPRRCAGCWQAARRAVRHQVRVPARPGRWPAVRADCNESPGHRRRRIHRLHVARKLLARGDEVVGLDNLNDYYDVTPEAGAPRAPRRPQPGFRFVKLDLADAAGMAAAVRAREVRARGAPGRAGRRALLAREPARPTSTATSPAR